MTRSLPLFYFLWTAPRVLQIIIAILLVRRGLYRKFPIFTAYIAFSICKFVALFLISRFLNQHVYFEWYSFALGISTALRFGIIGEVFANVFASHVSLRNIQKPLFRWTTVVLLIIAFCFAIYTRRSDADLTWFTVYVVDRSASIVQCGLILALFAFSFYLGLRWSRLVFGMALGLGVLCSFELGLAAVRSQIGQSAHVTLDLVAMGTYLCCVFIWLFYVLVPEPRPLDTSEKVPDSDLDLWNNELQRLMGQ